MIQDSTFNVLLPPPKVPLHKLREPRPDPVPPPVLPTATSTAAAPEAAQGRKKERRMELVGLEPGDPLSTVHLIKLGFKNVISIVPLLVKKYWKFILIALVVWFALASFNPIRLSMQFPALTPLWMFIDSFLLFMVFITASYNNFVAKALYFTLIMRVGLPLAVRIRAEGIVKVISDFKSIGPGLRQSWAQTGSIAVSLFIGFIGIGAFLSNYLTRNNRVDKIAVSLVLAIALMKALSDGPKSLPFMAGRVVMKDLFVMLLKPSPVRNHHIFVAVTGLAAGLLCSIPFAYLSKFISDYIGYYSGIVFLIAGLAAFFVKKGTPKGQNDDLPC